MRIVVAGLALTLLSAAPALAQVDPFASRAENQANATNRSMMQQQQSRSSQQQQQFENNAIRMQDSRPTAPLVPPVVVPRR